ncbi:hypothetical protein HBH64_233960 [Parastagonospora nodorum]|nr:hypothetical protein HBH46_213230 [Parastagonospora nodorum]KAH4181698.1 hypothetical protein HBH42_233230 [Parastagonospora nodorum]KAH4285229.1 hypothetical protein HBI02_233450 [Parastagonospora nodorum]KAH4319879.1 hypothetical protein HBI00_236220 [Parastagonospora nodorum]KAH4472618.1 hypothetical protein HBH88_246510 [Parastagonospora nodorum]
MEVRCYRLRADARDLDVLTSEVLEPPKPTKDGLLKPQEPLDAIDNHDAAAQKWQDVLARFEEGGLTEACIAWADKFRMCLDRLQDVSLGLPTAGVLYQFILAIADTYHEYARSIRRDPRGQSASPHLTRNNERQGNDVNNQGGGGRGRGRGGRGGQQPAPPTMTTSPTTPAPTHFNNLLMGLRQRAVARIAGASMPALTSSAEADEAPRGRADYKGRTILDTGANDHICNTYDRVVSWYVPHQHGSIKTGGGMVEVQVSGTIKLAVLRADSGISALKFSGVLYAPYMFVSLSHSMVRAKGCYCHGWREKLYRAADDLELAYTPDIDGVPNRLQVEDENDLLSAVRAMSIVLQHGSHSSHVPPTRKELHETFGHTDVNQLRKLAATTTCIEPTNTSRFACEVCMISKSRLQISRVVPDCATRLFQRVHVDLAGLISPPGLNGERYWSLYTEDYVRHRSIDLARAKEGLVAPSLITSSLSRRSTASR